MSAQQDISLGLKAVWLSQCCDWTAATPLFPVLVLFWMLLVQLSMHHALLCDKYMPTQIQFSNAVWKVDGSCFNRAFRCCRVQGHKMHCFMKGSSSFLSCSLRHNHFFPSVHSTQHWYINSRCYSNDNYNQRHDTWAKFLVSLLSEYFETKITEQMFFLQLCAVGTDRKVEQRIRKLLSAPPAYST